MEKIKVQWKENLCFPHHREELHDTASSFDKKLVEFGGTMWSECFKNISKFPLVRALHFFFLFMTRRGGYQIPVHGGEFLKSNLFTGIVAVPAISRSGPRILQAWPVLLLDM